MPDVPVDDATQTWLTIAQAAQALAVKPVTVRRLISKGDLPARRVGGHLIRIPASAIADIGRPLTVLRDAA